MLIIPKPSYQYIENYHALNSVLRYNDKLSFGEEFFGVEVGVRHGILSHYMLAENPTLTMHLVDPYTPYQDCFEYMTAEVQESIYVQAKARLEGFGDRVLWHKESSKQAAESFLSRSQDFVFIDAVHTYAAVKSDLYYWKDKVREGGVLCGHDYNMPEVRRAVDELSWEYHLKVVSTDAPSHVWFIEL